MNTAKETELKIANLLIKGNKIDNIGLLDGKTGLAIYFFQLARTHHNEEYSLYASELLDEVIDSVNSSMPMDFATGLTGIGWGIEYLIQNKFIEADADEVLEELDASVCNFFIFNDLPLEDIISVGRYYVSRLIYRIEDEQSDAALEIKYNVILLIDELERQIENCKECTKISQLLDDLYKLNIFNAKVLKLQQRLQNLMPAYL